MTVHVRPGPGTSGAASALIVLATGADGKFVDAILRPST